MSKTWIVALRGGPRPHKNCPGGEGGVAVAMTDDGEAGRVEAGRRIQREGDLEGGRRTGGAEGVGAVDEPGERILLVLEGTVHAAAVRGEVIGDSEILGEGAADRLRSAASLPRQP